MNQIIEMYLSRLTNGAHFEFINTVYDAAMAEDGIKANPVSKAALLALKEALEMEDDRLVLSRKSAVTDEIEAADRERDKLFSGYRAAVKGFLNMPVADVAKAAAVLEQHLKDYHIDPSMQLDRETGLIANLVADCESKYDEEVVKLGIKPYVTALKAANGKVRELIKTRTDDNAGSVAGALRAARRQSDEAYRKFVHAVNALVVIDTAHSYANFVDYVNEVIRRYKKAPKEQAGKTKEVHVG